MLELYFLFAKFDHKHRLSACLTNLFSNDFGIFNGL
ncbi:hypothetical protein BA6E_124113 [Bacteroidales bacterium 6E]|nr:hypothetical protein BA6E_124113 [Bacteroidales bacterium 6E]